MAEFQQLRKGELLLKEGDPGNSMYLLKSGALRLYKKKGEGFVELGMVHQGELIGEMSFLDGERRSASVEALQDSEVVEIPRAKFDESLKSQPTWLSALMKTLVGRLRHTGNRVRELDNSSTVYSTDGSGNTKKVHEFLPVSDILKLSAILLLVGERSGEKAKFSSIEFYGTRIFNIPRAKIEAYLATLQEAGLLRFKDQKDKSDLVIGDLDVVERFLFWVQGDQVKPLAEQTNIGPAALLILDTIHEFGNLGSAPPKSEFFSVDVTQTTEKFARAKKYTRAFDWTSFGQIVRANLSKGLKVNGEQRIAELNLPNFLKLYPVLSLERRFRELNQKNQDKV